MPQEDEVTSYVYCTSSSANIVSDREKRETVSIKKDVDDGIMEEEELSEELCVPKNQNIPRENCILVEPDILVQESEDPFFKRNFVKKQQYSGSRSVEKHTQEPKPFVNHGAVRRNSCVKEGNVSKPKSKKEPKSDVKLSKPQRRRRNKQLQKLLFQSDQSDVFKNLKFDEASTSRVQKVDRMGFSKPISQQSISKKVHLKQSR
ncbi:hypothetical protein L1987_57960 [Smallanthus sonchifolius]|uniref:Uncharacterized protein n=1 Tax=Smallanthus sonchifolius TaxID=185202 RepID=A0ACB9DDX5_9ASTR|nr:hypothetical protein L1987_57960 [Smallanthus sonchifolius]